MSADVESANEFAERLLRRYWQTGVDGTAQDLEPLIRKRDAAIRAQARAEAIEECANVLDEQAKRWAVAERAHREERIAAMKDDAPQDKQDFLADCEDIATTHRREAESCAAAIRQLAERTERDG